MCKRRYIRVTIRLKMSQSLGGSKRYPTPGTVWINWGWAVSSSQQRDHLAVPQVLPDSE